MIKVKIVNKTSLTGDDTNIFPNIEITNPCIIYNSNDMPPNKIKKYLKNLFFSGKKQQNKS